MKCTYLIVLVVAMMLSGGCHQIIYTEPPREQHYYVNPRANFPSVGRVVLLELDNHSSRPELSENLTQALADEMGKRNLFALQMVMRSDPAWQKLKLDTMKHHTFDDLAAIREAMQTDAVVFGTIQRYHSFPQLQTNLNLKMFDTRTGQLLWAIEQVWDSTDKAVERRMQHYFKEHIRTGYEPMNWQILVTSPRAFERFVAFEVAETFPDLPKHALPQTVEHRRRYLAP